jgi:hypothetical protein
MKMKMTARATIAAVAIAAALLAAGCARTVHASTPGGARINALNAGTLTNTMSFPSLGLTFEAPTAQAAQAGAISPDAALGVCNAPVYVCPITKVAPTIYLASATAKNLSITNADGTITRTVFNRLVYVIVWKDVECSPPDYPLGAPTSTFTAKTCQDVSMVDAKTGQSLGLGETNSPTG